MLTVSEQDILEQLCGIFMDHDPSFLQDLVASEIQPDLQQLVERVMLMDQQCEGATAPTVGTSPADTLCALFPLEGNTAAALRGQLQGRSQHSNKTTWTDAEISTQHLIEQLSMPQCSPPLNKTPKKKPRHGQRSKAKSGMRQHSLPPSVHLSPAFDSRQEAELTVPRTKDSEAVLSTLPSPRDCFMPCNNDIVGSDRGCDAALTDDDELAAFLMAELMATPSSASDNGSCHDSPSLPRIYGDSAPLSTVTANLSKQPGPSTDQMFDSTVRTVEQHSNATTDGFEHKGSKEDIGSGTHLSKSFGQSLLYTHCSTPSKSHRSSHHQVTTTPTTVSTAESTAELTAPPTAALTTAPTAAPTPVCTTISTAAPTAAPTAHPIVVVGHANKQSPIVSDVDCSTCFECPIPVDFSSTEGFDCGREDHKSCDGNLNNGAVLLDAPLSDSLSVTKLSDDDSLCVQTELQRCCAPQASPQRRVSGTILIETETVSNRLSAAASLFKSCTATFAMTEDLHDKTRVHDNAVRLNPLRHGLNSNGGMHSDGTESPRSRFASGSSSSSASSCSSSTQLWESSSSFHIRDAAISQLQGLPPDEDEALLRDLLASHKDDVPAVRHIPPDSWQEAQPAVQLSFTSETSDTRQAVLPEEDLSDAVKLGVLQATYPGISNAQLDSIFRASGGSLSEATLLLDVSLEQEAVADVARRQEAQDSFIALSMLDEVSSRATTDDSASDCLIARMLSDDPATAVQAQQLSAARLLQLSPKALPDDLAAIAASQRLISGCRPQLDKLSSTYLSIEALHPTSDDFTAASDDMSASDTFHVSSMLRSPHTWAASDPSLTTGPVGQADRGRMQKCINNRDLYTELMAPVAKLYGERDRFCRAASAAARQGQNGRSKRLIQKSLHCQTKARELERNVSVQIERSLNQAANRGNGRIYIDLHGYHPHLVAGRLVDVADMLVKSRGAIVCAIIVTGKGVHSTKGEAKVRPKVEAWLGEHWKNKWRLMPNNFGAIEMYA